MPISTRIYRFIRVCSRSDSEHPSPFLMALCSVPEHPAKTDSCGRNDTGRRKAGQAWRARILQSRRAGIPSLRIGSVYATSNSAGAGPSAAKARRLVESANREHLSKELIWEDHTTAKASVCERSPRRGSRKTSGSASRPGRIRRPTSPPAPPRPGSNRMTGVEA
jgi:hypothetical protein